MKKYILTVASLIIASSVYAGEKYGGKAHYGEITFENLINPYKKQGAYEDLLRVVDEYNRQNGKENKYFKDGIKLKGNAAKEVDFITVAQYQEKSENIDNKNLDGGISVHEFVSNGQKILTDDGVLDKLSTGIGVHDNRLFFENNNIVNNITFKNNSDFDETLKSKEKDIKYPFTGAYKRLGTDKEVNPLNMSVEDYKKNIEGKSKEEVVTYLRNELEKKVGKKFIQEGENLYTEVEGKKWKVFWNIEPFSAPSKNWTTNEIEHTDDIFADIYIYNSSLNSTNDEGRIIYTKSDDIFIEEKISKVAIKKESDKALNSVNQYLTDKELLSKEEFQKKWVITNEKNTLNSEIVEIEKKLPDIENRIKNDNKLPKWAWYDYFSSLGSKWSDPKRLEDYYNSKTPAEKALIDKYKNEYLPLKENKVTKEKEIEKLKEKEKEIQKKYGFYTGWDAQGDENKYSKNLRRLWHRKYFKSSRSFFRRNGRLYYIGSKC